MKVKDLMTNIISCIKENSSLIQAAKQMKQENIGLVPVCNDKGEVLGVITDRDIVLRYVTACNEDLKVCDIMSTSVVYVHPEMSTHDAALLMAKHQIRRLPVINNGKLVGMLSMADIARKTVFADEAGDALSAISQITAEG